MTTKQPKWLRAAQALYRHFCQHAGVAQQLELPTQAWRDCKSLLRRYQTAIRRKWHLAGERLQRDLRMASQRFSAEAQQLHSECNRLIQPKMQFSLKDLMADLAALEREFDACEVDRQQLTVSVRTEPIELEGIYLGPFEIRLECDHLDEGRPSRYRVVALEPHCASTNGSVTHPHVQDEEVCEGDGSHLIEAALREYRIFDFFTIVANLLRTYNDSSPYVALADWEGMLCSDCGATIFEDERWSCEGCECTLCDDCRGCCGKCDETFCFDCLKTCDACDQGHCRNCSQNCVDCDAACCRSCLDEDERCPTCHDKETTEEGNDAEPHTSTTVQSHNVGEATVPA